MNKRQRIWIISVSGDVLVSATVWLLFWFYRKTTLEAVEYELSEWILVRALIVGIGFAGLNMFWGLHHYPQRQSRLETTGQLAQTTLAGVLIVFFLTFLDDAIGAPIRYRAMAIQYFVAQFGAVMVWRVGFITVLKALIRSGQLTFRTVLVGAGKAAYAFITKPEKGYQLTGYVPTGTEAQNLLYGQSKRLGTFNNLRTVVKKRRIEAVILAIEPDDHAGYLAALEALTGLDVALATIHQNPTQIVLTGSMVKPLRPGLLSPVHAHLKRLIDLTVALLVLTAGLPFYGIVALLVKFSSPGPVFYSQIRTGRHGKPFRIYKFRTMYTDAEHNGPALATDGDPRITPIGRFLRKMRFDEFPQFYNVLRGEMSLVGPRPERPFFIEQITARAPEYIHLLKVKPGITSLGQVRYGYAENVDQMIERMKIDLLYLENLSLLFDLKIILATIAIVFEGRGK